MLGANVFPHGSFSYTPNSVATDVVFQREFRTRYFGFTYKTHIFFFEFCRVVVFAFRDNFGVFSEVIGSRVNKAPFLNAILRVVFFSAEKKMLGITACPIITSVKHEYLSWYFAFETRIRNTMYKNVFFRSSKLQSNVAVSTRQCFPAPAPASVFYN